MKLALLLSALMTGAGADSNFQAPSHEEDLLASSCLSESTGLFVLGLAAGVESPNPNAARNTARIAEACRAARVGLEPADHVCLDAVVNSERLAGGLNQVYAGRQSVSDFVASNNANSSVEYNEAQETQAEQCEARMSKLTEQTAVGETQ